MAIKDPKPSPALQAAARAALTVPSAEITTGEPPASYGVPDAEATKDAPAAGPTQTAEPSLGIEGDSGRHHVETPDPQEDSLLGSSLGTAERLASLFIAGGGQPIESSLLLAEETPSDGAHWYDDVARLPV